MGGARPGEKNIFLDPIYGELLREVWRPKYKFFEPWKGWKSPPKAIRFFGAPPLKDALVDGRKELDLQRPRPVLPVLFGWEKGTKKAVVKDLVDIKQLLITGTSGGGKSNAIRVMLLSLAYLAHPKTFDLYILETKGGLAACKKIGFYFQKMEEIEKKIDALFTKMQEVQKLLNQKGVSEIATYNEQQKKKGGQIQKYSILVVDEWAVLSDFAPEACQKLKVISATGRSAGFILIGATQRADHQSLNTTLKNNMGSSLSFAQRDRINANIAGVDGAEELAKPGECILKHQLKSIKVLVPEVDEIAAATFSKNLAFWRDSKKLFKRVESGFFSLPRNSLEAVGF